MLARMTLIGTTLFASACIFGSSQSTDLPTPDTGPDVGTEDVASPLDSSSALDSSVQADTSPPTPDMPDLAAPDGGGDVFAFERSKRRMNVVMPLNERVFADQNAVEEETLFFKRHLEAGWSATFEYVRVADPLPPEDAVDFAIYGGETEMFRTDSDTQMEQPIDIDDAPWWENPLGIPVINTASTLSNNMGIAGGSSQRTPNPQLELVDPGGPLSRGLSGIVRPYFDDEIESEWRVDALGDAVTAFEHPAVHVDTNTGATQAYDAVKSVLYAEAGSALGPDSDDNPRSAGERRVVLGPDEAHSYADEGWQLFDNAVGFVTYQTPPIPDHRCLLVSKPPLNREREQIDHFIMTRMRRLGCEVLFPEAMSMPNDVDVIVVSPTAPPVALSPLQEAPVPVLALFDIDNANAIAVGLSQSARAPETGTSWEIAPDAPAGVVANYTGTVEVRATSGLFAAITTDALPSGARALATVEGVADATTFAVAERGSELLTGTARSDRVALALSPPIWREGRIDSFDLFDSALEWLLWRNAN